MAKKSGVRPKKPVSILNQRVEVKFKDLFKALGKALVNAKVGKFAEAARDAVDAACAFQIEKDPQQLAWLLVHRSLVRAIFDLIDENVDLICGQDGPLARLGTADAKLGAFVAAADALDISLTTADVSIDERFFNQPRQLPTLAIVQAAMVRWLEGIGLAQAKATSIGDRLPSYFVFALNEEWRERRKDYLPLQEALDTPFTKASQREEAWARYSAWLQKQVDRNMFWEPFSLRQVYIPLRGYHMKRRSPATGALGSELARESDQKRVSTIIQISPVVIS
jgi:hypothetical protein